MISVVIAAYNVEPFLGECIDSVLNQTYRDLEIIVVDDGSTDSTSEIIQSYVQKDRRIVAIRQENQGPAAARNIAFDRMRGEYFTVIDADDWIESDCYEKTYAAANQTDADMVIWGFQRFSESEVTPQPDPMLNLGLYDENQCKDLWKDFIYREKRRVNPFVHCRLIRTSLVNDNGIRLNPRLKRSEDYMFLCQVHFFCKRVYSMADQMFLHYRQNVDSITHKYVPNYFNMVMMIFSNLTDFSGEFSALMPDVCERIDRMCLYRTFMSIENENLHEVGINEKARNVREFLKNSTVRAAAKRIGFSDGLHLYGKKYIALRMGLALILLKYCKG